jgi:Asp-tRNA(Asn)/Glu-tRNA(Gln) amidotransferase A subunit family amidase
MHGKFSDYRAAQELAETCRRKLDALFDDHDVMLTPAAFGEAPVGMFAFDGVPLYQVWTALHVPSITLPAFKGPNGLPVGALFVGRRHDDRKLFACARWAWQHLV